MPGNKFQVRSPVRCLGTASPDCAGSVGMGQRSAPGGRPKAAASRRTRQPPSRDRDKLKDTVWAVLYNPWMRTALSAPPVEVRDYRPQDLSTLHRIDRICFTPEIAFSRTELLFYVQHPHAISRIAERDGQIVGFAVGRVEQGDAGHVLTLDVVPDARRAGTGTVLMNALHEEFRNTARGGRGAGGQRRGRRRPAPSTKSSSTSTWKWCAATTAAGWTPTG